MTVVGATSLQARKSESVSISVRAQSELVTVPAHASLHCVALCIERVAVDNSGKVEERQMAKASRHVWRRDRVRHTVSLNKPPVRQPSNSPNMMRETDEADRSSGSTKDLRVEKISSTDL